MVRLPPYVGPPRKFWESKYNHVYYWRFGDGTINPQGDWCEGDRVIEAAAFTPENIIGNWGSAEEDLTYCMDEDLLMDEGL